MRAATVLIVAVGAAAAAGSFFLLRRPRQVSLPVYTRPVSFFSEKQQALLVGSLPKGIGSLSAAACGSCHKAEYEQWKGSAHAQSITEPVFAAAFKAEQRVVCRSCHSPLEEQHPVLVHRLERNPRNLFTGQRLPDGHPDVDLRGLPETPPHESRLMSGDISFPEARPFIKEPNARFDKSLSMEGVTCVTCHVREGTILTANSRALNNVPHPLSFSPMLKKADFCGGCHQFSIQNPGVHPLEKDPPADKFRFTDPGLGASVRPVSTTQVPEGEAPQQDGEDPPIPPDPGMEDQYQTEARVQHTFDEFKTSPAALKGQTCQSCHMPAEGTRTAHSWLGRDDLLMLRKAVGMTARLERPVYRAGEKLKAVITLTNDAGHRFPTGDSVHAGILDVWLRDGDRTLGRQAFVMATPRASFAPVSMPRAMTAAGRRVRAGHQSLTTETVFRTVFRTVFPGSAEPNGARLEAPKARDSRLIPGKPATLVFSQPVEKALASAKNPTLRVRVLYATVHPGFKGSRIDPKLDTMRLIHEETLPVRIEPPAAASRGTRIPAG
jgi:hypothetical protein